jgi:hypothetical protein
VGILFTKAVKNRFTDVVKNIRLGKSFMEAGIYNAPVSVNQAQLTKLW